MKPIWNNMNQSEPILNLRFLRFLKDYSLRWIWSQSEANLKSESPIWNLKSQSEPIWKLEFYNFPDYQSEMNLKAIWSQYSIWKYNSTAMAYLSAFVAAAGLSASIRAASSSSACCSAPTCLYLLTLITSTLAWKLALTLIYLIIVSIFIALSLLIYTHFF